MKHILFPILLLFAVSINCNGQSLVITSKYKAPSLDEMLLHAKIELIKEQCYNEWTEIAYDALEEGDRRTFLAYALRALTTDWYSAKLYYDIGDTYEYYGDLKNAKKYYRKAKRKGHSKAKTALERVKQKYKNRHHKSRT